MNEKCLSLLICVAVRARTKFSEKKKSCVDERSEERPIGARRRCSRRVYYWYLCVFIIMIYFNYICGVVVSSFFRSLRTLFLSLCAFFTLQSPFYSTTIDSPRRNQSDSCSSSTLFCDFRCCTPRLYSST